MKHIYCISGFGADERIFSKLDFGNNSVHFIPWKIPQANETIEQYAERMAKEITHPNPIIMGISFGGMMCIEIAKIIPVEKTILISSISTRHELPLYMKVAGRLHLNRLIPMKPYSFLEPIENYNLGVITKEEKLLVREYRKKLDLRYSNWAIDQILTWKNEWVPSPLIHIHGSRDHIFPLKNVKADYIIKGGGHLISMNNTAEVNKVLKEIL